MQKWHHHAKDARKQLPSPGHWAATPAEGPGASPLVETDASRTLTTTRCIGRKFLLSNPTRKNTFVWLKTCENPITSTKTFKKNQKIHDEIKKVNYHHWFLDNGFFSSASQAEINVISTCLGMIPVPIDSSFFQSCGSEALHGSVSLGSLGLDCVAGIALAWQEKLSYQLLRILNTKTNFQHWVKRTAASENKKPSWFIIACFGGKQEMKGGVANKNQQILGY